MSGNQFKTEQEEFWAGQFGDDYIARNTSEKFLASNIALFSRVFQRTGRVSTGIEFGSNIGLNLCAIQRLLPAIQLSAVEINSSACKELERTMPDVQIHQASISEFNSEVEHEFAFVKGVLIHINPDLLPEVYDKLAEATSRFVMIAEYYNPVPATIDYRGHKNKLFKRDFAGEFLDRHPEFRLVDYEFVWHRDTAFPQDDITWFLMEK